MEALSTILRSLRLRSAVLSRAHLRGRWCVHTTGATRMLFHGVVQGRCSLVRDTDPHVFELQAGDIIVLALGDAHRIAAEPGLPPVPISTLPARPGPVPLLEYGTVGQCTRIVCGTFELDHPASASVKALLPAVMCAHPADAASRAWAAATLALLEQELERSEPSPTITSLADSLFVHALSRAAQQPAPGASNLLAAVRDEQIGRALSLVHDHPGHAWSASGLAQAVGMSRTRFFDRFTELVGEPPARYVARWRVHAAADLMRRKTLSTAEIAEKVGYSSEDALAKVFKKYVGKSPREYRREREQAQSLS